MSFDDRSKEITLVRNILSGLIVLSQHLRIYHEENNVVALSGSRLSLLLERYFDGEALFEVAVARHGFLYQGEFVERFNPNFEKFANLLFMHGIGVLRLHAGVPLSALHGWLKILNRKPAETWDEGGMAVSLAARGIVGVEVVELADRFILKEGGGSEPLPTVGGGSELWERFALALWRKVGGDEAGEGRTPEELAARVSACMADAPAEEREKVAREVGEFLVFLQHENIRFYRSKAVEHLARYVNSLSPEMKSLFLRNVFNLSLRGEVAEEFFSSLGDDLIVEALKTAALKPNYVPPVVLSLLGRLARERDGCAEVGGATSEALFAEQSEAMKVLFRQDEFEKFVPERYRNALLNVVRSDGLQEELSPELIALKEALEAERIESHVERIVLEIIRSAPDERHFAGVRRTLEEMVAHHLDHGDYAALRQLFNVCVEAQGAGHAGYAAVVSEVFAAVSFIDAVIKRGRGAGREQLDDLKRLIVAIGLPFVDPLLNALAEESHRAARFFYMECLKSLSPGGVERRDRSPVRGQALVRAAQHALSDARGERCVRPPQSQGSLAA